MISQNMSNMSKHISEEGGNDYTEGRGDQRKKEAVFGTTLDWGVGGGRPIFCGRDTEIQ